MQAVVNRFLKTLDRLEYGQFELITPDGRSRFFSGRQPGPEGTLFLKDWRVLFNLLARGDCAFAEDYKMGLWETNNLQNLLTLALKNDQVVGSYLFGSKAAQWLARLLYMVRSNSLTGSKRNIHAHYDLGNEFYSLWLDSSMTYSSALFSSPHESLLDAQTNKYDRILDRLNLTSGRLMEIGCGWGGFADRASSKGDFDIKAITISQAQHDYAKSRLGDRATVVLEDYRVQDGKFDHLVSIEMFEAVGERYWKTYFAKVKSLLAEKGRAVIQTITIDDDHFESYRRGADMIRSYIFPGGMLPSPSRFAQEANKAGLQIVDRHDFGQDYARTLGHWLERFDECKADVLALGFDEKFIRLWRFYLAACIAGFQTCRTDVMQVELRHA